MASRWALIFSVFVQFVCVTYSYVEHTLCLSCPPVGHPHECKSFVEIGSHEQCFTKQILLANGSNAYEFGHQSAMNCENFHSTTLSDVRQNTAAALCHECCSKTLCNRRLCGVPGRNSTNLACLDGSGVSGLSSDTSIAYCEAGERCYARRPYYSTPHALNSGNYRCASQAVCDHRSWRLPNVAPSTLCQRCCSQDACNALLCHSQGTVIEKAVGDTSITTSSAGVKQATTQTSNIFTDCWDLRNRGGFDVNGIYDIYPPPAHSHIRVKCDMTTDGGGWTILQRRYDGSLNFTRTFQEYTNGFGIVTEEHWLGLERIHVLTSHGAVKMRIDLCTFAGQAGFIAYNHFSISFQSDRYRLHTGAYGGGSVQGWLYRNNGEVFSTIGQCADIYKGGWWYHSSCYINANINGGKYNGGFAHGILWANHSDHSWLSLRSSEMKIRPVHVTGQTSRPYTCPP